MLYNIGGTYVNIYKINTNKIFNNVVPMWVYRQAMDGLLTVNAQTKKAYLFEVSPSEHHDKKLIITGTDGDYILAKDDRSTIVPVSDVEPSGIIKEISAIINRVDKITITGIVHMHILDEDGERNEDVQTTLDLYIRDDYTDADLYNLFMANVACSFKSEEDTEMKSDVRSYEITDIKQL